MKKLLVVLGIVAVLVILFLIAGPFYVLQEGEYALVMRFGQIVGVEREAGLKMKMPFSDTITTFTKKIEPWHGEARQMPTSQQQFVYVDAAARWRIADPEKFYMAVTTMEGAYDKLSSKIDSAVRTVVSSNKLAEILRYTNAIREVAVSQVYETGEPDDDKVFASLTTSQTTFENIERGRAELADEMLTIVKPICLAEYGIEVLDIGIVEISYPENQLAKVYERMISDLSKISQTYRDLGAGQKAKWDGAAGKAQAEIIGTAKANAAGLTRTAYSRDPAFFAFWRAIESYKKTMPSFDKTFSTDMDYFKYLYSPAGR